MYRIGGWLPPDHRIHQQWLQDTIKHVDQNPKELHPLLAEFKEMVENDTRLYLLFNSMFDQIPQKKPYTSNPAGNRQVRDFTHMLQLMNHLMTTAPSWSEREHQAGLVGLPFHAILDWPMGTPSGFAVFQDPNVNAMLKKILNAWSEYLTSPDSAQVLGTSTTCWLGETGKGDVTTAANDAAETSLSFEEIYNCDPSKKYHGFTSWDNFFTRTFRDGIRPTACPDRDDVIANSCESVPYKVARDVQARDKFWIKGQPYSVLDMLARDERAESFVGGTIYQAFLSALSYHRWHSPVSGKIVKAYIIDGTYYSEPPYTGAEASDGPSSEGENTGQEYLSALATRALIFIEADNPDIGLMCVMPIGMVEVSTCEVTVKEGQHVKKGDQLGMVSLPHSQAFTRIISTDNFYPTVPFRRLDSLPIV
jgi:phosphatidylserine decarboxylase